MSCAPAAAAGDSDACEELLDSSTFTRARALP